MDWTRSTTRNRIHEDDDASSRKGPKTCALWSDLDHDLLHLVMMQLVFVDYYSFRGVCKSWSSFACVNENMVMASMPPMSISFSNEAHEKAYYLEDFEGRKIKTFLPHSAVGVCVGLTCGYLIFFIKETRDFLLVNPITKKKLHFPGFPVDYQPGRQSGRAILVFSPSMGWVFVLLNGYPMAIWFSTEGKGAWSHVSQGFHIIDLYAFKGKIYTLSYNPCYPLNERFCLCELRLSPQPNLVILGIKPDFVYSNMFVSLGESLYVMSSGSYFPDGLHELDLGEMKWVPCENTFEEYTFLSSRLNHGVAVEPELWARSRSLGRDASFPSIYHNVNISFCDEKMWYFPHECMNVDRIDE